MNWGCQHAFIVTHVDSVERHRVIEERKLEAVRNAQPEAKALKADLDFLSKEDRREQARVDKAAARFADKARLDALPLQERNMEKEAKKARTLEKKATLAKNKQDKIDEARARVGALNDENVPFVTI